VLHTARRVHPNPGCWDLFSRIKYCLRALLTPRLTREWIAILAEPKLTVLVQNHPHIFSKLQRSYLDSTPGPWSRLRALKNHYRFVILRLSGDSVGQIHSSTGLVLLRIALLNTGGLELRLGYHDSLSKEGEMAISIHDTDTWNMLAALSFCVWQYAAQRKQAFVGGLQSFKSPKQKERIIAITRDLHGLRPKALLFFALQQLAATWGLDSIRAVSDSRHVYRHYRKRKKVAMSYDEFWPECGGQLGPDGLFTLPAASTARDMSEMKRSKRQMYRRRYVLLQQFASQIGNTLARHTLPESPADRSGSCKPISSGEAGLGKLIGIYDRQGTPGKWCTAADLRR
jgi:uncharacterized protein VirK/YbjX